MRTIFNKIYPYFGVGGIEAMKHIDFVNSLQEVSGLFFQVVIGVLTIYKLTADIINKRKNK